jgi:hypothetical protein
MRKPRGSGRGFLIRPMNLPGEPFPDRLRCARIVVMFICTAQNGRAVFHPIKGPTADLPASSDKSRERLLAPALRARSLAPVFCLHSSRFGHHGRLLWPSACSDVRFAFSFLLVCLPAGFLMLRLGTFFHSSSPSRWHTSPPPGAGPTFQFANSCMTRPMLFLCRREDLGICELK